MYDRSPYIPSGPREECLEGWPAITRAIRARAGQNSVTVIECYPGVFLDEVCHEISSAFPKAKLIRTADLFRPAAEIDQMLERWLGDDPVFGMMNSVEIEDFFHPSLLATARARCGIPNQPTIVIGTGASLVCPGPDLLVYADMARWEI
ncbi:MAG TPA: hypothetical protein VFL96_04620 [Acidobacteriaceae bacterium]|nr:hypothetical protein [Acidobacteriaceae bacterium]